MNKIFTAFAAAAMVVAAASCSSTKKTAAPAISSLNGEWSVVAIDNEPISSPEAKETTYLGFNTATGEFYGNASCNMLTGRFAIDAEPGVIDLTNVGVTRMACPDMTVENALLGALSSVKGYREGDEGMELINGEGKNMVSLARRDPAEQAALLHGDWNVKEINNQPVDSTSAGAPYVFTFGTDAGDNTFAVTTDCNNLMGEYETTSQAIKFGKVMSTRMACPDSKVEQLLMQILPKVTSFGKLAGGGIGLYDADSNMLLLLEQ